MERTINTAHARIDELEKEVVAIKTEVRIQFKDLFGRVKRLETILIGATGTILVLLVSILTKMD
jgi:tetrahydromethanopterin S-methyltransferase subunit G